MRRQQQSQRVEQQQIVQQQQDIPNQYYVPQQQHVQQQQHQQYQLPQTHCSAAHAQTTCASFSAPALVGQTINSRCDCVQGGGEIRDHADVPVGEFCALTLPTEVRGHNNDYATGRRSPPPASSSTFIHHVNHQACTKSSSPFSSWPQSGPQYEKLVIDVSLDHAPDFDTSSWNRNGVILIPVDTLSAESEYHDPEVRAIMYNGETGASFPITSNYCMNANYIKDLWIVLEKKYPRIESDGVIFPLFFKSKENRYFLPVFKEAGSDTRF
jgi:hypothetical protein